MSKIAFVLGPMFEDSEFRIPYDRLRQAGHEVDIVGVDAEREVAGKRNKERVTIERAARDVGEQSYDALVIPGGFSPDHLRTHIEIVRLVRTMGLANKPVAAVCHGPSLLIEADLVDDRMVTSWPSIKTDLINAGAHWVDREVVIDGNLITSRKPEDLVAFATAVDHMLAAGVPARTEQPVEHAIH